MIQILIAKNGYKALTLVYKFSQMLKNILFIFFCLFQSVCYAQKLEMNLDEINPIIKNDNHGDSIRKYFSYTYDKQGDRSILISAFYANKLSIKYSQALKKIPQFGSFSTNKNGIYEQPLNQYAGRYTIPIFDSTGVIVTVNGINPQNVHEFEFRVVENNNHVVLTWTKPKLFTKVYLMSKIANPNEIDTVAAYLGQFKTAFGSGLTIQVRQINDPDRIKAVISAYWLKWPPRVKGVFTFAELPDFLTTFKNQFNSPSSNQGKRNSSRDSTLLKLKKEFKHDENNLIFYLDDVVRSKKIIEYNLVNNSDSTGWKINDFDFNLVWLKNLSPGDYELKIRYSIQRESVCTYSFTIIAAWYQTLWAKIGFGMLVLLAAGFILLLWRSKLQAQKLKTQSTSKRVIQTELKSIRSQFNPHFVFNALSSIQGLITKNDTENASKYLVEFGNLMRDSLKASNNEFVSIASELKILNNYLMLEKLRFGFNYKLETSDLIDSNAVEIPSLFLQPLLENAVKHGISSLQEKGELIVSFEKLNDDMIVSVRDNGKGFTENEISKGFGLQLTKERIKLLNQTLNEQLIAFSVMRINNQTHVKIHFKNWLI
jgi:two-component system LytT family sensor kinase